MAAFSDYVDIVRRLLAGGTVSYDGAAGTFESLRMADGLNGPPPPIWSGILGLPKAARLAGRIGDGVILQPYLTPEAVRRAVVWIREERERVGGDPAGIRICAPVVIACELDDHETAALTRGRLVTYLQMKAYADGFAQVNDWDPAPMLAIQNHHQFANLDRANADQAFHRDQLLKPGALIPDDWINDASAVGSVGQCVRKIEEFKSAGADEVALYGSTPMQNTAFLEGWRQDN